MPGGGLTIGLLPADLVGPGAGFGERLIPQEVTDTRPRIGGEMVLGDLAHGPVTGDSPG